MEVSVIGNSQVNVGRASDICFSNFSRDLNAQIFSSVRNNSKGCVLGQNRCSLWPSRSALGLRIRASASSAPIQAAVSEKASKVTRISPNDDIKLYVGLPLDSVSISNTINHSRAIYAGLKALKLLGVAGVELPIWWGIVENEGPRKYDWTGCLAVIEMVRELGLEARLSLCFHASSESKIPLPNWVSKIGESDPSIYFADRTGRLCKECLTWSVDDLRVLDGRSPMEVYKEFFENFKSAFSGYMGCTITGLTIGLGPNGELCYPSHPNPAKVSSLTGPGEFQCYDKNMLADLKCHAEMHGCPLWGLGGPHDAPAGDQPPFPGGFFDEHNGSWETPYGHFFLSWYSGLLVAHGARVLSLAASTFESSPVQLFAKIPLMHAWCKARSHPSELTAGFYNTETRDGYGPVLEMFSKNLFRVVLTGLELDEGLRTSASLSHPESLLAQVVNSCRAHMVEVSGENSEVSGGFERIKNCLTCQNDVVRSFTYQRMGAYFFSPEHFPEFTRFVRGLNGLGRTVDDFPVEDEESVGSLARKNLRMQTA